MAVMSLWLLDGHGLFFLEYYRKVIYGGSMFTLPWH